jgi:hypothetical protein
VDKLVKVCLELKFATDKDSREQLAIDLKRLTRELCGWILIGTNDANGPLFCPARDQVELSSISLTTNVLLFRRFSRSACSIAHSDALRLEKFLLNNGRRARTAKLRGVGQAALILN